MAATYNFVPHNIKVSDKFFKKLETAAKKIADEEAKKMAIDMQMILRLRFKLKGEPNSRFPKWNPSPKLKPKSKESYKNWKVQERKNSEYWLSNVSHSKDGTYNYVKPLVTGKGWNTTRVGWNNNSAGPNNHKLVRGSDGGLYSSQMPQGLGPWRAIKREEMKLKIQSRMIKEL